MAKKLKVKQFASLVLIAAVLVGFATTGCESSTTVEDYYGVQPSAPFDPSKPVTITEFTPISATTLPWFMSRLAARKLSSSM